MATLVSVASLYALGSPGETSNFAIDQDGNLFGTTEVGGGSEGLIYEIAATPSGYASPVVLASFNDAEGVDPDSGLLLDASGNLFGTAQLGGVNDDGVVFELQRTDTGYAANPVVVANFDGVASGGTGRGPAGNLLADAAGNLFGITFGLGTGYSTVFEIVKTPTGYASTPVSLAVFSNSNGPSIYSSLSMDAAGDVFGTIGFDTAAHSDGSVFEIVNSVSGYASQPITLASFKYGTSPGASPYSGVTLDAKGDLFGTTISGGATNAGEVYEIPKTATGFAATPIVLASLDYSIDGDSPFGNLLIDAAGNLFGRTSSGGPGGGGTIFEVAKAPDGYAAVPEVLAYFGNNPSSIRGDPNAQTATVNLAVDQSGNLFGTTNNLTGSLPAVYEIIDSGFQVACYCCGTLILSVRGEVAVETLTAGDMVVTAFGEQRAIKWIGRRSYAGRFLTANPNVQPIRFHAGSLGHGLPRRDLLVSPEHSMFLDGVLIPARCLLNGSTILQERGLDRVDYVHIELNTHDVLLAEGAPSESFLDDDSRGMFHNAHEFSVLYPNAARPDGFCALRVEQGAQLEAIRRRLASVAGEIALTA